MTLEAIKRFLTSAHVLHLERECEYLRGQNAMLHVQLMEALKPTPAPQVKREFPKFVAPKTSWESYLAEQIALQEKEEDGTHSSGRV
jgi:hypothetical protein